MGINMKLVEFSVQNYRSITSARKIKLHSFTVLLGKNNEGKSNLLTALNVAMKIMLRYCRRDVKYAGLPHETFLYDWRRDFPVQFQDRKQGKESIFKLNFRLEDAELKEFHEEIGIRGNEDIPIVIKIGMDNKVMIGIPKKGSSSYKKKAKHIVDFISKHISFNYIQAVRTEEMTIQAIHEAVHETMEDILDSSQNKVKERYQRALQVINEIQQEILDKIANNLYDPLKLFIPNLTNISIRQNEHINARSFRRPYYRNDIDVYINDGVETNIANKGDGIKSLVTLAILKEKRRFDGASVIAIEEPESHLHPGAIHNLADVIHGLIKNNQVIISTHNPLFVQRNKIRSNIIIDSGVAHEAKSIQEIREILGVWTSDNLKAARFVIVVEGENDKIALTKILSQKSQMIRKALNSNRLVVKYLGGTGNLFHTLVDLKNSMCQYVVLLDNDNSGKNAAEKAKKKGLLRDSDVRYTTCLGQRESEFEDCIQDGLYKDIIENKYKINMHCKEFHSNKKWSERMKSVFLSYGAQWDDEIEKEIKSIVANSIPENIDYMESVLIKEKCGFIDGMVMVVEKMLEGEEL